ncbi:putative glycosyl hydrolase [Mobilisporobacter senegalensis]|uniref:Putative glycosyl hydrolase n=1 Tax=Mobilisporobacter senegalensis TaxID=1329262 RepID=A0A3N1XNL4_9FIRM|nr:glycosyl hydrolase family 65 protein [Mobilisporobacter senegalensis]ROR28269.1 putative glycosyl hydrolase [Mobilisporobacter senegalensis]
MNTSMNYSKAEDWYIEEEKFDSSWLGKCEAIMCLGNGYLGLRSATEEEYLNEKRGYFVAGTFNKFDDREVTELPNIADIINLQMIINGCCFTLDKGTIKKYSRKLNLRTGELSRCIVWISPKGDELAIEFYRVVSMADLHLIAQKVIITPINSNISLKIISGINGRITNSGSQHLSDGDKRLYEQKYMQLVQTTGESQIDFVHNTSLSFMIDNETCELESRIIIERRKIYMEYEMDVPQGIPLVIQKISNVYTSREPDNADIGLKKLQEKSLSLLKNAVAHGYDRIAYDSATEWGKKVWDKTPIKITAEDEFDQLSIRFAQYHLAIMVPSHDNRMSIGAKGLSGEGYKGHTFWDTDIFVLPYFIFTDPQLAKQLEQYRYLSLNGARAKALSNGFSGAQFPWESAWLDDGEVTPVWGAADIITGEPTKIWSGFIEQHITSDVSYGIWQYYKVTDDQKFMDQYGYEVIFDTANFWVSRLEFSEEDGLYHINNVVGPDEYKEHADDNAYTNYMAYWNIKKAMEYYQYLKEERTSIFNKLLNSLDLDASYEMWVDRADKIYLPVPREEDLVIPQDKYYLTYKEIDLTNYKSQTQVDTIFLDYNIEQINHIQVSKQADIMMLFLCLEDMFSYEVKKANWDYYEPRTLHDSSLSLSSHCILANDLGDYDKAYDLFRKAAGIDLGTNMKSSDSGIHAASIGGIWQCIVYGFGGVRMINGKLRIEPKLPKTWSDLEFPIIWHGQKLIIKINKNRLQIENITKEAEVEVTIYGKSYHIDDRLEVDLPEGCQL